MEKFKSFKKYFGYSMIAILFVLVFATFRSCSKSDGRLDFDDVNLVQLEGPKDGDEIVIFDTSLGTFKAVLYRDKAPKYVKYFTELVEEGYYDDTYIFSVEKGVYFMGGSKTNDGKYNDDTNTEYVETETHKDLWPFKGALCSYIGTKGFLFSKRNVAGSSILFINSVEFDDSLVDGLRNTENANQDVVEAFIEYGGIPNFSQQYTIFGQVYEGMDVYDEISNVMTDSNNHPKQDIKFNKVTLSIYTSTDIAE